MTGRCTKQPTVLIGCSCSVAERSGGGRTCLGSSRALAPDLTRIIHDRFYCNRGFAAATSLHAATAACRLAGSPLSPSTYCSSTPRSFAAPRARLATRLRDFETNRHE